MKTVASVLTIAALRGLIFVAASGRRLVARIRDQRRAVLDHALRSLTPDGRESLARGLSEPAGSPP